MFGLGTQEIFFLAIIGILLYGKRLPEVSRSLGRTVMEFKGSLRGMQDEFHGIRDDAESRRPKPAMRPPQRTTPSAPKFSEPPEPV